MHALALLSLLQPLAGAGAAPAGENTGTAAPGGGAANGFAELLAGLLAMAGQLQPVTAAESQAATPDGGGATGTATAASITAAGTATAAPMASTPTPSTTTLPTTAAAAAAAVAVPLLAQDAASGPAPGQARAPTTVSQTPGASSIGGEASPAGDPAAPPLRTAVPPAAEHPRTPGEVGSHDARSARASRAHAHTGEGRATPATPSVHANAAALATPSRTQIQPADTSEPSAAAATAAAPAEAAPAPAGPASLTAAATAPQPTPRADIVPAQPADPSVRPAGPASPAAQAALNAASRVEANLAPAQQTAVPGTESAVPKAPAGADALVQTQLLQQDPELQAPPALAMGAPVATAAEPSEVGPKPLLPEPEAAEEPSASKANLKPDAPTASAGQTSGRENSGGGDLKGKAETAAPVATAPEAEGAADQPFEPLVATTSARTETTTDLRQPGVARATPETVAGLAAQMARRIEGRNTRFEIALDPAGLGSVQVSVEINPRGELSAHLSFERGDSAAELRSRAAELQRALEQAGFDLSKGGLSFEHGPSGRGQERSAEHRHHGHARAFAQALDTADAADLLPAGPVRLNRARSGVDLTV